MKRAFCGLAVGIFFCSIMSSCAFSQEQPAAQVMKQQNKEQQQVVEQQVEEQKAPQLSERDILVNNINVLRSQEIRVAVIQQVLSEEVNKLMQGQTAFCQQYNLDVEKFKAGLYRYDNEQGKFVEMESQQQAQQ